MHLTHLRASPAAASLLMSVLCLAACGDDSSSTTGGGSSSATSTAEGPTSGSASGGGDGSGGDATSTTQSGPTSSTSTSTGSTTTSTSSGTCTPSCEGRACGPDGCDGSCGACDGELVCSSSGTCIAIDPGAMSFFITSVGNLTGDFGGVDGADAYCQGLAANAGAGERIWRAYVSTATEDARDRIGAGPWFDATGAIVADSVAGLHQAGLAYENALDEHGAAVPNGKTAPGMNEHDILTGSNQDGTFSGSNCGDFTSSSPDDGTSVGHCDASFTAAGGSSAVEPSDNWNATHVTNGCDEAGLFGTGSAARLYCFATD